MRKIAASKSQTFLAILLAFALGVTLASFVLSRPPLILLALLAAFSVVAVVSFWKTPVPRFVLLAGLFFVLGLVRFEASAHALGDPRAIAGKIGETVSVRGTVATLPRTLGTRADYVIEVEDIFMQQAWQPTRGRTILETARFPEFSYGDRLVMTCELERPAERIGELAVRRASAACEARELVERVGRGASDPILSTLFKLRAQTLERIERMLPEPQAGLLAGLLVGERSGLTEELRTAFRRTGTTHLVAISGFNVAIVTFWLFNLATAALGRKRAFWLTAIILVGFVFFVGASASVVRAAIMGGIVLLGKYLGRPGGVLRLLIFAAALMLAANPWLLRYDLGFVLSFAATFGLVVFGESFARHLRFIPETFKIRETLAETVAATFATLPFTLFAFGQFSVIAPLANLLALLLVPPAMLVGFVALVIPLPPLALAAWAILTAIVGFVERLGSIAWASVAVSIDALGAAFAGLIVVLAAWLLHRRTEPRERERRRSSLERFEYALFVILLAGVGLTAYAAEHPKVLSRAREPGLEVTIFDVGQGDAIFVETPEGKQMLIDGGPDDTVLAKLGEVMPRGDRDLDLVVITHPHADHIAGLVSVLERYRVDAVMTAGIEYHTAVYDRLREVIAARNLPMETVDHTEEIDFSGMKLDVLHPVENFSGEYLKNPHDANVVIRLVAGAHSILLTGDAEDDVEAAMVAAGEDLGANVLKVGHHGSKTSSSDEFLRDVAPDYAVISVGENSYGHPHPSVLGRLGNLGIDIFRTDEHGDVTIRTDGTTLCISTASGILDCK